MKLEDLYFLVGELKPKILSLEREYYEFFRAVGFITHEGKHDLCTEGILCTVPSDVIIPMIKTFTRGILKMKLRIPPRGPGYGGDTTYELKSIEYSMTILMKILFSCESLINTWLNMLCKYDVSGFTPTVCTDILDTIGKIKGWYAEYNYWVENN